ncbi:MAG: AAA family ATPase [Bacilli bacterium]|nr:AAA family ATPase [Bacilli bacterium]
MRREMYDDLLKWKSNPQKKPLIIYGPRQVGKTYLINEFGKNNYENIFYINFEIDVNAKNIFAGNLDIKVL